MINKKKGVLIVSLVFMLMLCFSVFAEGVDEYTKLLLHMDGDVSGSNHTATVYGNPVILDTSLDGFSEAAHFDGSGDYLSLLDSDDWDLGLNNFTLDMWVYIDSYSAQNSHLLNHLDGSLYGWYWDINSAGNLVFVTQSNVPRITSSNVLSLNKWYHLALVGNGSVISQYIDGKLDGSWTGSVQDTNVPLYISADRGSASYIDGYIDELRISKGIARWNSNFTPQRTPYSTDSYTKLLLHMDGDEGLTTFTDSETTPKIVSVQGDTHITGLGDDFGDAMEFDGSGDYLVIPDSDDFYFSDENFTIDLWMKPTSLSTSYFINQYYGDTNRRQMVVVLNSDGSLDFWGYYDCLNYDETSTSAGVIDTDSWHHVAIVREGTGADQLKIYVDGNLEGQGSQSEFTCNAAEPLYIGRYSGGTYPYTGYLDELRISKGTAKWTQNFTPPDRSHTVAEYTSLLFNFDGDDSDSNHPITFAASASDGVEMNATEYKFDGSYYFDGNDYLTIPDSDDFDFGDENFTVDFWAKGMYNYATKGSVIQMANGAYGPSFGYRSDSAYLVTYLDSDCSGLWDIANALSMGTVPNAEWVHYAVVRAGDNISTYRNGQYVASVDAQGKSICTPSGDAQVGTYLSTDGSTRTYLTDAYIDELRISKGIARWNSNFNDSLPSGPYEELENFLTKVEFELRSLAGISELDNSDGSVIVSIHKQSDNSVVVSRPAAVGVYDVNMSVVMVGDKFNLDLDTNYTYNLSTNYGDFLYDFTTPEILPTDDPISTKMEFEIDGFSGLTELDNIDGTKVDVIIKNASSGAVVVSRDAVAGVYDENMTVSMQGSKFDLLRDTLYTFVLSTVDYGEFLYNFTLS